MQITPTQTATAPSLDALEQMARAAAQQMQESAPGTTAHTIAAAGMLAILHSARKYYPGKALHMQKLMLQVKE